MSSNDDDVAAFRNPERLTADLAQRLRETAINDEGQDWWASALLREAADAIDSLTADREQLDSFYGVRELKARLAAAEAVVEAAREATLWQGDKYIEDLREAIALYEMPLDSDKTATPDLSEAEIKQNMKAADLNSGGSNDVHD